MSDLVKAVEATPEDCLVWNELSCRLPRYTGRVDIGGVVYTRMDVAKRALQAAHDSPTSDVKDRLISLMWNDVGLNIPAGESAVVEAGGDSLGGEECFARSLELAPFAHVWMNLAQHLHATHDIVSISYEGKQATFDAIDAAKKYLEMSCLAQGKEAYPWFLLATYLPNDAPVDVVISGEPKLYTRRELLITSVTDVDPSYGPSWEMLGTLLGATETLHHVSANGESAVLTKLKCIESALRAGRSSLPLWHTAMISLDGFRTINLGGPSSLDQKQCCIKLIEMGTLPSSSSMMISRMHRVMVVDAIKTLAGTMSPTETIAINDVNMNTRKLYTIALELVPTYGLAWCNLGVLLPDDDDDSNGALVNGECVGRLTCYIRAVEHWRSVAEIPPGDGLHQVWVNVSGMLRGSNKTAIINGTSYTRKGCLLEALKENPNSPSALHELALLAGGPDDEESNTQQSVQQREAAALNLYKRAIFANPDSVVAWHDFAYAMNSDDVVHMDLENGGGGEDSSPSTTTSYTKVDCFRQALRCDPLDYRSWQHLSNAMITMEGSVEVNGKAMTYEEVAAEASRLASN